MCIKKYVYACRKISTGKLIYINPRLPKYFEYHRDAMLARKCYKDPSDIEIVRFTITEDGVVK